MGNISCDETGQIFLNPFKSRIKNRFVSAFDAFNGGDSTVLTNFYAKDVSFWLAGNSVISGELKGREACEAWFSRLKWLIQSKLILQHIDVSGMPWNTMALVRLQHRAEPLLGEPYINDALVLFRIRWGSIISVRYYLDTHKLMLALENLANNGVVEAAERRKKLRY